jgi:hypothetical protein
MLTTILVSLMLFCSYFNTVFTTFNLSNNKYDSLSNIELQKEYQKQLEIIKSKKKNIEHIDSLGIYLHTQLISEVFPAWYGTEWDYNGYTNKPREGIVACGYFVSTTLKHVGFNLNRFDLAKMYSSSIVKSLCAAPVTFHDIDNMFAYILEKGDHLYVVGLSTHVGFIEKKDGAIYFIHSNYIGPIAVEKELAKNSDALNSSDVFVLGNISGNSELMKKWRDNIKIIG